MNTYRRDLAAAGIEYLDEEGRQADFHALRLTSNRLLAQAKVPPRTAMELMRHTDIKLTRGAYTDMRMLVTAGAVEALPAFGKNDASVETPFPVIFPPLALAPRPFF